MSRRRGSTRPRSCAAVLRIVSTYCADRMMMDIDARFDGMALPWPSRVLRVFRLVLPIGNARALKHDVIETILTAIAPVILTALLGFFWTRIGRSFDAHALTQLVTEIGTPCLVFSTFARMTVPAGAFAVTAAASLTILVGFLLVASAVLKPCGPQPAHLFAVDGLPQHRQSRHAAGALCLWSRRPCLCNRLPYLYLGDEFHHRRRRSPPAR